MVSERERVIVVIDGDRNKGMAEAVDWALKHVVRPKDTVIVVGVVADLAAASKKQYPSCFPINVGITISGIWEKLEFSSGHAEVINPREIGEEIERKREQFQANLQPFYRQCKRNEVKLEVKLAAGICPSEITLKEAQNSNTRWIVLDSRLKKHKLYIYGHVECNVAVMKGKDVATLMPSRAPKSDHEITCPNKDIHTNGEDPNAGDDQEKEGEGESSIIPPPSQSPCWYPLQWRVGFPREFSQTEIEAITNGFADILCDRRHSKIYEGVLHNTPVVVKSFDFEDVDDERWWSMLTIRSRLRHRNIMNIVGYCCSATNRLLIFDFPCLGTVEFNLLSDTLASNLPWRARWCTAIEIGGSLRYLHEECPDGPIVHQSVCSSNIAYSHGYSAMLCSFTKAKLLKDVVVPSNVNSKEKCPNREEDKWLSMDIHDYGTFLVELITGKIAECFPHETEGQSLIDWALPLLESGSLSQVMDPRLMDKHDDDSKVVQYMARAALLCLKNDKGRRLSISEVLAVVRGDQLAIF